MVATLTTIQDALDARWTRPSLTVYVGGVLTRVVSFEADFGVGETAGGSLVIPLPAGDHVVPGAEVEVQAGHNDLVGTVFSGFIPNQTGSLSVRGKLLTAQLRGWSAYLTEPERDDLVYQGPIGLDAVFVDLCQRKDVPSYIADRPTYVDGVTPVKLGGNTQYEDGTITIKADQSPLSQLQRMAEDYGYPIGDIPQGPVRLSRVSGMPNAAPVVTLREGVHLRSVTRGNDIRGIINEHDVQGVVYEDEFGVQVPIRSRPLVVELDDRIPGGRRKKVTRSNDIVRQDQADAIRQRLEMDTSEADTPVTWEGVGVPGLAPGDVVEVISQTVGASGLYWLMRMRLRYDQRGGFTGSYDGWAGAGEALPSLVERTWIPIQTGVTHLGDEYVGWYAVPSPQGLRKSWPFTIPAKATHVAVRGWGHSWNSQLSAGANKDLSTSKWDVHADGADRNEENYRPVASGTMRVMPENYLQRPDFTRFTVDAEGDVTDAGYWLPFACPLKSLEPGDYDLEFVVGKGAGYDDGEVRLFGLDVYGANEPAEVIT